MEMEDDLKHKLIGVKLVVMHLNAHVVYDKTLVKDAPNLLQKDVSKIAIKYTIFDLIELELFAPNGTSQRIPVNERDAHSNIYAILEMCRDHHIKCTQHLDNLEFCDEDAFLKTNH